MLCSRGSLARTRHLLADWKRLMPHVHGEAKFEKAANMDQLNEMAELANCSKCIYFESRKRQDVYMWLSEVSGGPSVKFLVHNMHTMNELSLAGNCLKGSRPVLSFDPKFDAKPHLKLLKELLKNTFKTPNFHPRSQPFIDHVLNFAVTADGNIWIRNYQIVDDSCRLEEIGPRMVLEVIKIFSDSFHGSVLYDNPNYKSPNNIRRDIKLKQAIDHQLKQEQSVARKVKQEMVKSVKLEDPVGEIFNTVAEEDMKEEEDDEDATGPSSSKSAARKLDQMIVKPHAKKHKKRSTVSTENREEGTTRSKKARREEQESEDED